MAVTHMLGSWQTSGESASKRGGYGPGISCDEWSAILLSAYKYTINMFLKSLQTNFLVIIFLLIGCTTNYTHSAFTTKYG